MSNEKKVFGFTKGDFMHNVLTRINPVDGSPVVKDWERWFDQHEGENEAKEVISDGEVIITIQLGRSICVIKKSELHFNARIASCSGPINASSLAVIAQRTITMAGMDSDRQREWVNAGQPCLSCNSEPEANEAAATSSNNLTCGVAASNICERADTCRGVGLGGCSDCSLQDREPTPEERLDQEFHHFLSYTGCHALPLELRAMLKKTYFDGAAH